MEKPESITVEATAPCMQCKTLITRTATTKHEKELLYASLKAKWICEVCFNYNRWDCE